MGSYKSGIIFDPISFNTPLYSRTIQSPNSIDLRVGIKNKHMPLEMVSKQTASTEPLVDTLFYDTHVISNASVVGDALYRGEVESGD